MRVIIESLSKNDITEYLTSDEVLSLIHSNSSRSVCMKILSDCGKKFQDTKLPSMKTVSIYKVNPDNSIDILSSDHVVLQYDGYFYDYCPEEFQESFQDDLSKIVPVIQKVINSKDSISRYDSNIKGYSIVGGKV